MESKTGEDDEQEFMVASNKYDAEMQMFKTISEAGSNALKSSRPTMVRLLIPALVYCRERGKNKRSVLTNRYYSEASK